MKKIIASFLISATLFLNGWCVVYGALVDNVISYWKLDESSGTAEDIDSTNDLTNNNTVTFVAGKINNGAQLEDGKYFSINDASQTGLNPAGSFYVNLWYKGGSDNTGYFVSKWISAPDGRGLLVGPTLVDIVNNSSGSIESYLSPSYTITEGVWYMITMNFTASTRLEYFVNAVSNTFTTSSVIANMYDDSSPFQINGFNNTNQLNGIIDEVEIGTGVLTQEQITAKYNAGNGCQYPFVNECVTATQTAQLIIFD